MEENKKPDLSPQAFNFPIGEDKPIETPKTKEEPEEVEETEEVETPTPPSPTKEETEEAETVEEGDIDVRQLLFDATGIEIDEELTQDVDGLVKGAEIIANQRFNQMMEDFFSSNEEIKKFTDYLKDGGDPIKYIRTVSPDTRYDEIDVTDESNQKRIITDYLTKQSFDKEEIKDLLKDYEDSNMLEKQAKIMQKQLVNEQKKERDAIIAQQQKERELAEKEAEKTWQQIDSTIEKDSLAGIPLSKKDKDEFKKFLRTTDKEGNSIRVQKYNKLSLEEKLAMDLILFKGLDSLKSMVEKTAKTQNTKDLKSILSKAKDKGTASGTLKQPESKKTPDLSPTAFTKQQT